MKAKTLLVAAVMFFGLTAAAFAGATFTVGSTPVTAVIKTGLTEKTGDITFSTLTGSLPTDLGTFTVSYGVPITNVGSPSSSVGYTITGAATTGAIPTISTVDKASGLVVINVTAGFTGNFTLTGVRVAIYGTAVTSLTAQISAVNNNIVAGQTSVTVITAIGDGLVMGSGTAGVLNLLSGATTTNPIIKVKEGFLNAFGVAAGTDQTNGLAIRFTLSGLPPVGYTITFPGTATSDGSAVFSTATAVESGGTTTTTGITTSGAAVDFTSASTSLYIYYMLTSDSDPTKLETLSIPLTLTYNTAKGLPVPSASISYTATLYPIGIGLTSAGAIPTNHPIPRYAAAEISSAILVGSPTGAGYTDVLIPFASRVGSSGYDTGIAVSNTTADPGTTILGVTGAVQQTGAITFYFYNAGSKTTAPTTFTYTTQANSPGAGLNALGQLPPGATYAVLLHELIVASQGIDMDFSGYVFIVTGFGNAHVQYMLTDFKGVANGGQGLIITEARTALEALMH